MKLTGAAILVSRDTMPLQAARQLILIVRRQEGFRVGRLRYSLTEARAEATRRAEAFVADRADRDQWLLRGAAPNTLVPPSQASKHPVAWVVIYAPVPPEGSGIDGGELFVAVDLELGTISLRPW